MEKFLLIIGLIVAFGSLALTFFFTISSVKDRHSKEIDKTTFLKLVAPIIGNAIGLALFNFSLFGVNSWNGQGLHIFESIFGGVLFGLGFSSFLTCFVLNYYKTSLENANQKKIIKFAMFISIPFIIIGAITFTEGIANYISYPLYNAIVFGGKDGFISFSNVDSAANSGIRIAFYGILIVSGAVLVYFICDHKFYQTYGKHGILDICFLIAFPAGIIGARLWFCLVLKPDWYFAHPLDILKIYEGGLAIMGGAIFGIIAGVTYMLLGRKYVNIRKAMDIIVPTILIAQAVGRFGNFFNHEVYGNIVNSSDWWFIPTIIRNHMSTTFINGLPSETMYIPLFLIEGLTNLSGYFIITYAIGKPLKKYMALGDKAGLYLIWYGATRAIMEPLRFGESGAVDKFDASWYSSFALIAGGVLLIVGFHIYEIIMKKKFGKDFSSEKL